MFGRVRHLVTPSRYNFSLNVGYLASARTLGAARSKSDKVVKKHTDEKLEPARLEACGPEMDDEEDEMEEMFVEGPAGMEWGVLHEEVGDLNQQGLVIGKGRAESQIFDSCIFCEIELDDCIMNVTFSKTMLHL